MAEIRFTGDCRYTFPTSPRHPDSALLASRVADAASRLSEKLMRVDVQALEVSDYFRAYLRPYIECASTTLQRYSHILFLSLRGIGDSTDVGFVDYGGGTGLLSLLAREAGVAEVIYSDIYDVSCVDARTLAVALGLEADHYVEGGIEDLISYMHGRSVRCRSIGSNDVIEHVYDVDSFLRAVPGISSGPLRVVLASGANSSNPMYRRMVTKQQRESETLDRPHTLGEKQFDTTRAYRGVREEMIRLYAPTLTLDQVRHLGAVTRGLRKSDIEAAVDRFLGTGESPVELVHRTNTCDPYTGNWCEHLMDPFELAATLSASGIPTRVRAGYWGNNAKRWKGMLLRIANTAIRVSSAQGLRFAPYYVLYGDRT